MLRINLILFIAFLFFTPIVSGQQSQPDSIQDSSYRSIYNGYSYTNEDKISYSVIQLDRTQFNKGMIISPFELITGHVPGLQVTSNSGMPGDDFTLVSRNRGFEFDKTAPLLVVDGLIVSDGQLNLPESDIESITVMNDLSASAIYGEMGSNGVILITTKKGTNRFHAEYNAKMGISWLPAEMSVYSGDAYRNLVFGYSGTDSLAGQLGSSNTDWQKEIYQKGFSMDHQLSISGTTFQTPWRLSVGNTLINGIVRTSRLNRTSYDLRLNPSFLKDHLSFDLNLKGLFNRDRIAPASAIQNALTFDPTQPVYDNNIPGGYFEYPTSTWQASANPLAILELTHHNANTDRYLSSIQGAYKLHFLPDLKLAFRYVWDHSSSKDNSITDPVASWTGDGLNSSISRSIKFHQLDAFANFTKQIGVLDIDVLAGYSQYSTWQSQSLYAYYFANPSRVSDNEQYSINIVNKAYFGSAAACLLNRYILNVAARYDRDSRYASHNQTGLFPSVSLGWNMKNEAFLKNVEFISALKPHLGFSATGVGIMNSPTRLSVNQQFDPEVKREKRSSLDAGLDFGLMAGRIQGSLNYYSEITDNLLVWINVPSGGVFLNYLLTNMGSLKTTGVELSTSVNLVKSENLKWNLGFNGSFSKPVIQSTGLINSSPGIYDISTNFNLLNMQIESAGFAPHSYYLFQQVYTADGKPIEGLYVDRSGEGGNITVNSKNKYHAGKPAPDYLLGVSSQFMYKNWELSFSGHASIGNYAYNYTDARASYNNLYNYFTGSFVNMPRTFDNTGFIANQYASDYFVRNASFFRMDYISLEYDFSKLFSNRMNLHAALTLQNAFLITKYNGQDPEMVSAIDSPMYPRSRILSVEIHLGL